jgi:hypothetical protein
MSRRFSFVAIPAAPPSLPHGLEAAASREHRADSKTAAFAWKERPCERDVRGVEQ